MYRGRKIISRVTIKTTGLISIRTEKDLRAATSCGEVAVVIVKQPCALIEEDVN